MTYLQRKKLAFMSIVNQVKGFVRTVSGALPLTLYDCVDARSIIDYSLAGTGVGNYDEDTGKYKIPVKCSGINLFNPEEVIAKFDNGDIYTSGSYVCTSIQLKPNTQYYLKTFNPTGGGYFYLSINEAVSSSTKATISINDDSSHKYPRRNEKTATTDDTGCMYIGFYSAGDETERCRILRENQIQIVEGSYTALTAPDYEPYQEPVTVDIIVDEPLVEGQTINFKENKLPIIPTYKGTTIVSVDTQVQPLNMEVTYYSTSKG